MTDLPDPPVPADLDLRDFPSMLLDVVRLRDSSLASKASPVEFRASVLLWCSAWHQMPAGSLPNDDDELMRFAGLTSKRLWMGLRSAVLRSWTLCNDGRIYHSVVCEKAIEALDSRTKQSLRTEAARSALAAKREKQDKSTKQPSVTAAVTKTVTQPITAAVTADCTAEESSSKGREGKVSEGKVGRLDPPSPLPKASQPTVDQEWQNVRIEISKLFEGEGLLPPTDLLITDVWAHNGWKPALTLVAVKAKMADMRNRRFVPKTLGVFKDAVAAAHQQGAEANGSSAGTPAVKPFVADDEHWRRVMRIFLDGGKMVWLGPGGQPDLGQCIVPQRILDEFKTYVPQPRSRPAPTVYP